MRVPQLEVPVSAPPSQVDPVFWDGIAEKYAAQPVADPDAFERKIAHTRALIPPDGTVLEVGCGTGSLALRLAPSAGRIVGVDCSPEMVRIARGKAGSADHVQFVEGTVDDAPAAPGSVDLFCAFSILHLVPDRAHFLERAFAVLKPGGHLVSSTVCLGDSWIPYRPVLTVMRWAGKAPWVDSFSSAQLMDELRAAGFVDVEEVDVGTKDTVAFLVARKPA